MKIWVTGSSGSGKSTLADQIGKSLNIKVYYADQITWQDNWVLREKNEQVKMLQAISSKDEWIFDGNKLSASKEDGRYENCDLLIHLEKNRLTCGFRVINRYLKHRHIKRHDLAEGCEENLDLDHLIQVLFRYPKAKKRRSLFFKEISLNRNIKVITDKSTLKRWIKENNITSM